MPTTAFTFHILFGLTSFAWKTAYGFRWLGMLQFELDLCEQIRKKHDWIIQFCSLCKWFFERLFDFKLYPLLIVHVHYANFRLSSLIIVDWFGSGLIEYILVNIYVYYGCKVMVDVVFMTKVLEKFQKIHFSIICVQYMLLRMVKKTPTIL